MLNKDLLMATAGDGLWTAFFRFNGDSGVRITIKHQDGDILWEGELPISSGERLYFPPKSSLSLSWNVGVCDVQIEDGILSKSVGIRELELTVFKDDAYLGARFTY